MLSIESIWITTALKTKTESYKNLTNYRKGGMQGTNQNMKPKPVAGVNGGKTCNVHVSCAENTRQIRKHRNGVKKGKVHRRCYIR